MPVVRFVPLGKKKEIREGATILAAANQVEVPIGQSCNGDGICGWCKVRVVEGLEHLAPPSTVERKLICEKGFDSNERAACMAKVQGDITVTTTYW
jgi:2Fe-2S ferredoxin